MFVIQISNQMKCLNNDFSITINLPLTDELMYHIECDLLVHIMYRLKYKLDDRIIRRLNILTSEQLKLELLRIKLEELNIILH